MGAAALAGSLISSSFNSSVVHINIQPKTYPFYTFKWILGVPGNILCDLNTWTSVRSFASSSYGGTPTTYNISGDLISSWTELNAAFDFTTNATATLNCDAVNDSLIYVHINYPKLFADSSATPTLELITPRITSLVRRPWAWNPPGGLFSLRGPRAGAAGTDLSGQGSDFNINVFGTVEPIYSALGQSWSNFIWSYANGVGWNHISAGQIRGDVNWIKVSDSVYKWNTNGAITWNQLENVIFNTGNFPTCELHRDWSKWGTKGIAGFGIPNGTVRTNCGLTTGVSSAAYPDAISLQNTKYYTCTTGAWNWGNWGLSIAVDQYGMGTDQQFAFTYLKDIYDTFDGFSSGSTSIITTGANRFPGAIKIVIDMGLYTNTTDTARAQAVTLQGKSLRDVWLDSPQGKAFNSKVGIVKAAGTDASSFSFTVADYADTLGNIAVISELLFMLQTKIVIPVDFSKLPSDHIGGLPNLALRWSIDLFLLNGGVIISVPPTYIPFFNLLKSASFTADTTWHDIDWSSSQGNSLTTDSIVTVCQAVNGASSIPTGFIYGTCANSSLDAYKSNSSDIYKEVTKFSNQFAVVKSTAAGAISKISTLIATIKGSNTVYYNILTDAQRKTLTNLQNQLPNLQAVFTSASATLNQLNASLFTNTSQLSVAAISAMTCQTQTTVTDIENLNDAVKAAYKQITDLFNDVKTSFADLKIPIESGIPDITTSLASIQQRLVDLAAGISPLGTSACLLNPESCAGSSDTGNGTGNATDATTNKANPKAQSNIMMYVGIIVGVLLVGGLIYWFYFRKPAVPGIAPAPTVVYMSAPVAASPAPVPATPTPTVTPMVTPMVTPTVSA